MSETPILKPSYVYVIGTMIDSKVRTYVGWTYDIEKRIKTHNAGKGAKCTKGFQWKLIYSEQLEGKVAAMSREWYLKKDKSFRSKLRKQYLTLEN